MLLYFFTLQLLGYRIFRWLFNFTISWLFNFTKFWRYKVTYYNNELITVSQTIVGRWPPCHVLQQSKWVISGRMGHGDHHPTLICIPNNEANHSRTGSPCPVLQQEARVFTPLSNGEGMGVGLLYIYAILRAFSETHQITV